MNNKHLLGLAIGVTTLLAGCGSRHETAPDTRGPPEAKALADAAEIGAERPEVAAREAAVSRSPEKTVRIDPKANRRSNTK